MDILNQESFQININIPSIYHFNRNTAHYPAPFKILEGAENEIQTMIAEILAAVPDEFSLGDNYPNPFNPVTSIQYSLREPAHVKMSIYDMLGREITTLVNEYQDFGFYNVRWDGTNHVGRKVSSGVYFYLVQMGSFKQIKKMVLLK